MAVGWVDKRDEAIPGGASEQLMKRHLTSYLVKFIATTLLHLWFFRPFLISNTPLNWPLLLWC